MSYTKTTSPVQVAKQVSEWVNRHKSGGVSVGRMFLVDYVTTSPTGL